jgi:P4 family phage/plasmid primase-like protien
VNKDTIKKFNLFPLVAVEKYSNHPYINWSKSENQINDVDKIESLSEITGACLLTGKSSGILVIDLDNHMGGVSGIEEFKKIWSKDLNTLTISTPNNGLHLYFQYREGLKSIANVWPGVDIKTDGGLIMTPGSQKKKEDGIIGSYEVILDEKIQEIPEELFQKIVIKLSEKKKCKINARSGKNGLDDSIYKTGKRNNSLYRDGLLLFSKSSCRDYNTVLDVLKGLNLLKSSPPLDENEVEGIAKSVYNRMYPDYCNEKGHVVLYPLMEHLLKEQPIFCRGNLTFQYSEADGCYIKMDANKLYTYYFSHCQLDGDKTPIKAKNFVDLIFMVACEPEDSFAEKTYINCKNGLLEWKTGSLIPHDSKYRIINQIKVKYREVDLKELEKSRFKQYLDETLDQESILTLQEACGLALSPHAKEVQKCFVLLGLGGNGKSVILNILHSLVGSNNVSSIGFSDFSRKFDMSQAEGIMVNVKNDDDMTGLSDQFGTLWKSFTCGEPIRVERKFKDINTMTFNTTSFYGLNKLPSVKEKVEGVFRRLCLLEFKKRFGTLEEISMGLADAQKDPLLEEYIIKNELEIVLYWAVEGLKRLNANNWVLTESKTTRQAMENYKLDSDSVYGFFKECIRPSQGKRINNSILYATYKWWCEDQGLKPMNGSNLGKQLKALKMEPCKIGGQRGYKDIEVLNPLGCVVNVD